MLTWIDCFGALAIVWCFLIAVLFGDWSYQIYDRIKRG